MKPYLFYKKSTKKASLNLMIVKFVDLQIYLESYFIYSIRISSFILGNRYKVCFKILF